MVVTCWTPTTLAVSLIIFPRSLLLWKYSSNCSSLVSIVLKSKNISSLFISKCEVMTSINPTNTASKSLSFYSKYAWDPNLESSLKNSFQKLVWYLALILSPLVPLRSSKATVPMPINWTSMEGIVVSESWTSLVKLHRLYSINMSWYNSPKVTSYAEIIVGT